MLSRRAVVLVLSTTFFLAGGGSARAALVDLTPGVGVNDDPTSGIESDASRCAARSRAGSGVAGARSRSEPPGRTTRTPAAGRLTIELSARARHALQSWRAVRIALIADAVSAGGRTTVRATA
jgi:hypothetical protein